MVNDEIEIIHNMTVGYFSVKASEGAFKDGTVKIALDVVLEASEKYRKGQTEWRKELRDNNLLNIQIAGLALEPPEHQPGCTGVETA